MFLFVGLGNPGREYAGTRHNVGFDVLDAFAERRKIGFAPGTGDYWFARVHESPTPAVLLKPTSFMNNSGDAVADAAAAFGVRPAETVVVYDDFHLPLGTVRIRMQGTDGGHNGMASIIWRAGTDAIPRVRCGIAPADTGATIGDPSAFVLSGFGDAEQLQKEAMVARAADALETILDQGLVAAMNLFNVRPATDAGH